MEAVSTISPATIKQLRPSSDLIRFPATFEFFCQLLEEVDFPVEYDNGEIIIMSIASDYHERIVANIMYLLVGQLRQHPGFGTYGSNRHVFIEEWQKAFSPDASVVKGDPIPYEYAKGKSAYTNPWLIVEVTSPTSRSRDFGDKLLAYQAIDSLQYVLLIAQDEARIHLYQRQNVRPGWQSQEYIGLEQKIEVAHMRLPLSDVYHGLTLT